MRTLALLARKGAVGKAVLTALLMAVAMWGSYPVSAQTRAPSERWFVVHYEKSGQPKFYGPHPTLQACEADKMIRFNEALSRANDVLARATRTMDRYDLAQAMREKDRALSFYDSAICEKK